MKQLSIIALIALNTLAQARDKTLSTLWYKKPSDNVWENALPIENGRQAAMIYGNVEKEIIQLNEHTVWSGGPNRNDNPDALAALPKIRKMIFEENHKETEKLANKAIITKKSHGQMFQSVGNLNLTFDGHKKYSNYYRELNIEKAISTTSYVVDGVTYTREALASFTDRAIIIIRLSTSKVGSLTFTANYSSPHKKRIFSVKNLDLQINGTYNSLFDAHPPFQIDGNFGCTSGITEMLMQSDDGAIHLLPALPDVWPSGNIGGLKARGGFEIVEMIWEESKLVKLVVKSALGGNLRLRLPNEMKQSNGLNLKTATGENPNPFYFLNETAKPVISAKANLKPLELKPTILVDMITKENQTLTFLNK